MILRFVLAGGRTGLALLMLVLVLVGLAGCAASNLPADDPDAAYTASDAPETRKRATNRLQLAVLYFQDGKSNFALDEIKQAIQIDPGWYEPYWMRGLIQMQGGDYPAADASFQRALAINPRMPDLQHNYGVLLCKMKRYDEGLQQFAEALANPAYAQVAKSYLEQGSCLEARGDKVRAEASYQKSFERDAANSVTALRLASLLYQRGDFARAQFYARRVNNSEQATADSLLLGVRIERRLGQADAAAQLAAQLRKRFADSAAAQALDRGEAND